MKFLGNKPDHKRNPNKEAFHGISPSADRDAELASEEAFKRIEQQKVLGEVTLLDLLDYENPGQLTDEEKSSPQTNLDRSINA